MKTATRLSTTFLLAALLTACNCLSVAVTSNPVSRVVTLMKSLSAKLENEMKKEEDLFDTYACWAKSLTSEKEAAITKAERRIEDLTSYVADIDAGKIEFTTERTDLEKELAGLNADIETATAQRESQNDEFKAAEAEMNKAISALEEAIQVLETATKNSLITMKTSVNEGFHDRVVKAQSLERAVEISRRFLSAGDARFLAHLLAGEVPDVDWKKLNRKATFKMKYMKRSGDIQKTLADLLSTFKSNLKAAQDKETAAVSTFGTLMSSKNGAKSSAEQALSDLAVETGAKSMSKDEAEAEIGFLNDQVTNDKQIISDTALALKTKTTEYKTRKDLQLGELAAFSKAISIINSDDARNLFKKSFGSQGYMLTQIRQHSTSQMLSKQRGAAAATVLDAGRKSGDSRLAALATRIALSMSARDFTKVIAAIDSMLSILSTEGQSDVTKQQACLQDHETNAGKIATDSRSMDDKTRSVRANKASIIELTKEIEEKEQQVLDTRAEIFEATKDREAEHLAWKESDADDTEAASLVSDAKDVLENFYKDNSLAFVQGARQPDTWDGTYKGATTEKNGIISILGMVHEDILADKTKAKEAEDNAKQAYDTLVAGLNTQIKNLNDDIDAAKGTRANKDQEVADWNIERASLKNTISATLQVMKDKAPTCDFMTVNFEVRKANRENEVEGLRKAKTILQAAHEA
mmetsp:Transcript_106419/g.185123  ORF Transcript_106419/g.185123 Transcript_106419/m.185123 type:complete len:696 (+) Transcript_106419:81-2168(+)